MDTLTPPSPTPTAPELALRTATTNFLVIWRLFRLREDPLSRTALLKADRTLHNSHHAIRSEHLLDNDSLMDLYSAQDNFLLTWDLFGLLPNWTAFAPVLDQARLHLQSAFGLTQEPTQLV
jgi:hypothetical protein